MSAIEERLPADRQEQSAPLGRRVARQGLLLFSGFALAQVLSFATIGISFLFRPLGAVGLALDLFGRLLALPAEFGRFPHAFLLHALVNGVAVSGRQIGTAPA